MDLSVTEKQLKNLLKGKPVQLKHSALINSDPNVKIGTCGGALTKKVRDAIRLSKGVRVTLNPDEIASVTALGGKINVAKSLKKVGKDIQKGFKKNIVDTGVGKEIAKTLIDVGTEQVLPLALSGVSTYLTGDPTSGEIVGKVAGEKLNKLAGKYGYGMKGKGLKIIKDKMTTLLKPVAQTEAKAKSLTNKIFKEGTAVLDLPEISIKGGKISMKKIGKTLKKAAKDLWNEAKPVLKYYGEEALKMAEPIIEEGLASVAESYGVDPAVADVASKSLVSIGKKKATRGLNKHITKKPSQTPEMAVDKVSMLVQERGDKMINDAKMKGLESIQRYVPPDQRDKATELLLSQTQRAEDALRSGVESAESATINTLNAPLQRMRGGRISDLSLMHSPLKDDMSTLLNVNHPATMPLKPRPNVPQGQIYGGSFRGYSGKGTGGSFL